MGMAELLDEPAVSAALANLPEWSKEGKEIARTYKFSGYLQGIEFVRRVGEVAEMANHHPDMLVGWRKVTVRLSTHSAGGLTDKDFSLARQVDGVASEAPFAR